MTRALPRALPRLAALIAVGALVLAGCASSPSDPDADSGPSSDALTGDITVFAAASLTDVVTTLADDFERANPGTSVELSFAGSSDLAAQIIEGAPADVFASADEANMAKVVDAQLVAGDPVPFATNVLQIAVPPGDPAGVRSLADLADPAVRTVVCAPQVPCGAATERVERAAGITIPAVSEESSVTDVLGKVVSGEADAGLVYVTDVAGAGDDVEGVAFDESADAVNVYPVAVLADSGAPDVAAAFRDVLLGPEGTAVLAAAGFGAP
jgi:molybdate transport system substrate-binding protein